MNVPRTTPWELSKVELALLESYMLNRTVPLLSTQTANQFPTVLGTSTFFDIAGEAYLVTAEHVFDDVDMTTLAFPANPWTADNWTLGTCERLWIRNLDTDVCVLKVMSPEAAEILRKGWQPLSLELIGKASRGNWCALCGYPQSLTRETETHLLGKLVTVYTLDMPTIPSNADQPVDPQLDLFLLCDDVEQLNGTPIAFPVLKGTSGCSIWEIRESPEGELWIPEKFLHVVAVNSAYREGQYIRAKRWWAAARIIAEHGSASAAEAMAPVLARL